MYWRNRSLFKELDNTNTMKLSTMGLSLVNLFIWSFPLSGIPRGLVWPSHPARSRRRGYLRNTWREASGLASQQNRIRFRHQDLAQLIPPPRCLPRVCSVFVDSQFCKQIVSSVFIWFWFLVSAPFANHNLCIFPFDHYLHTLYEHFSWVSFFYGIVIWLVLWFDFDW